MKTPRSRSILAILIAMALLISVSVATAHRATRMQTARSGQVLPGAAYSELVNGLSAGGR